MPEDPRDFVIAADEEPEEWNEEYLPFTDDDDMQDDDGLTPMKSHSRFIEKQVAGQDE